MSEKVKLTERDLEMKRNQLEEFSWKIEAGTLQVEMLEKEIKLELPMKQKRAQLHAIKSELDNMKRNKLAVEKQIKTGEI